MTLLVTCSNFFRIGGGRRSGDAGVDGGNKIPQLVLLFERIGGRLSVFLHVVRSCEQSRVYG